jgi:RNA polymerase sigma-70 factor (ECF subfamily)
MRSSEPDISDSHRGAAFTTTHWSVILTATDKDPQESARALEALCRAYWPPLYAYVRRSGYERGDAQDLTQSFFARLLAKDYLSQAQLDKGRFRSFLLASLKHFLANEWDRAKALKRGGGREFISWDDPEVEARLSVELAPSRTPENAFERQWALTLLDQVFARLRDECVAAGKVELFDTLRVYLSGEKAAASYAEAGAQLSLSAGAVQVAVHRLRRRYGELLRAEIASTVERPEEVDAELRYLFTSLRD